MLASSLVSSMRLPAVECSPSFSRQAMKDPLINGIHTSSSVGPGRPEDLHSVQRVVQHAFRSSQISVTQAQSLDNHFHQIRFLQLSDGGRLVLKTSPRPTTRLLRHEEQGLDTEARALSNLNRYTDLPIPKLIKFDPHGAAHGPTSAFLLMTLVKGVSLDSMQNSLPNHDRQSIDRQLGNFAYLISAQVSPVFGTISDVSSGSGFQSWREAFLSMLESVLRDGEDMLIQLPYDQIRTEMNRLTPCLCVVTRARLVVPNLGNPSDVLIDPDTLQVSGLLDFTGAFWGDQLAAKIFQYPSTAFLEGYGCSVGSSGLERLRKLLYSCYRSIVAIVTHYSRNRNDDGELQARMSLTQSLSDMAMTEY